MKKPKADNKPMEETLPFTFLQDEPDDENVKAHWGKIKERINKSQSKTARRKSKN